MTTTTVSTIATPANPNYLDDGATAKTASGYGMVGGNAEIFDSGSTSLANRWDGVIVANINALNTANSNSYILNVQGSNSSTFASGVVTLATTQVGQTGQLVVPLYSLQGASNYEFFRLQYVITGSGGSITCQAFVMPLTALPQLTAAELTVVFNIASNNWIGATQNFLTWMYGTATGGPNSDGRYPLYDGLGNTVLALCPAALAAQGGNAPVSVGLFSNLANLSILATKGVIQTSGWSTSGLGGARYNDTTGTTLAASGKGLWWQTTVNGRQFSIAPDQELTPMMFGALCNGSANDSIAIQACHDYIKNYGLNNGIGNGNVYLRNRTYNCLSQIVFDPTRVGIVGNGANLNFNNATYFTNPATVANINPDPNFSKPSLWTQGNLTTNGAPVSSRIEWQIDANGTPGAVHPNPQSNQAYGDIGILISPVPGAKYQMSVTIAQQSYSLTAGESAQCYVSIGMQNGQLPGYGGGDTNAITIRDSITAPTTYTWVTEAAFPSYFANQVWLELKSSNTVTLTNLTMVPIPDNACLKIQSTSQQYGQVPQFYEGFYLNCNNTTPSEYADGIMFDTEVSTYSSRIICRNIQIYCWGNNIRLSNRSYLCSFYGISTLAGTGIYCDAGAPDAGENFSFYGCTLGNGNLCLNNVGGMELNFYSCSFDYSSSWVAGYGRMTFYGSHFEGGKPTNGLCALENYGGNWSFYGCYFLLNDNKDANNNVIPPVMPATWNLGHGSVVQLFGCDGYNWTSATGYMTKGLGRLIMNGNTLGGNLEFPNLMSPVSVDSRGNPYDFSNRIGLAGTFINGIYADVCLTDYTAGGITATSRTSSTLSNGNNKGTVTLSQATGLTPSPYGTTTGLRINRNGSYNSPNVGSGFLWTVPLSRGSRFNAQWQCIVPTYPSGYPVSGGSTVEIYFEVYYRNMLYRDSLGRPVFADNGNVNGTGNNNDVLFLGEIKPTYNLAVAPTNTWFYCDISTLYVDTSTGTVGQGYAPEWANCISITLNEGSLPAGADVIVSDLKFYEFR